MTKLWMLIVAIVAALSLTVVAAAPAAAGGKVGGVIDMSAQDPGGDSQCQNGTVLNVYSWRWFAYVDGGGYVRLWDDAYYCNGGHYEFVGGFWS